MTVLFMTINITSFYERSEIEITKDMNVHSLIPKDKLLPSSQICFIIKYITNTYTENE